MIPPPLHIKHAWALLNNLEGLHHQIWDLYERDFLEYFIQELTMTDPRDEDLPMLDGDDIPF